MYIKKTVFLSCLSVAVAYAKDSAYDQSIDHLKEFFITYGNKQHDDFVTFLKKSLAAFPQAYTNNGYASNPVEQQAWVNGSGQYANKGFKDYTSNIEDLIQQHSQHLKVMQEACAFVREHIPSMTTADMQNIANNQEINAMKARITEYLELLHTSMQTIKEEDLKNKGNPNNNGSTTILTDDNLREYSQLSQQFQDKLIAFKQLLQATSDDITRIFNVIQYHQNKLKENNNNKTAKSS